MTDIAILGCGPAGMLAAHAVAEAGFNPVILSKKVKSQISGAQYLHEPIYGLTPFEPEGQVCFLKVGDRAGYAAKVYGREDATTSWERYEGVYDIWRLQNLYDRLWASYADAVEDVTLDAIGMEGVMRKGYDMVISSVSAKSLCYDEEHYFNNRVVDIYQGIAWEATPVENLIMMSGRGSELWYRSSQIFGTKSTEYPAGTLVQGAGDCVQIIKPVETNCTCWGEVLRVGRYGTWDKSALVHDAWMDVTNALHRL